MAKKLHKRGRLIIDQNEFLKQQLDMLQTRLDPDSEIEWSDISEYRYKFYNAPEHKDTTRKSFKGLYEYLNAGWTLIPPSISDCIDEQQKPNVEYKPDGSTTYDKLITICEGTEMTPEFMLEAHGLDKTRWKIISYRNNYWHSQIKGGKRLVMYQSKITVKPYEDDEISFEAVKEWFENFEPKPITFSNRAANYGQGNNCHLLPIVDLHYNMLATSFITGNEYNCQIARDRFLSVIDDNINRIKDKGVSKIIFPVGNDLFNANGINGTTFKGTQQTNEKHIFEAYKELFELMTFAISKLADVAPVEVIYIPSNHDKEITFYFLHNLYTQFRNVDRVEVDISPIGNKYRRFGNTLMMFSHDAKIDKIANIVFDEAQDMLDGVKYIDVFLAHLHTESVKQERNVTVRRLPTISGKSNWTVESGYGANLVSQSFIINDTTNISDALYTSVN
jgi:hypothetical protein